LSVELDDEDFQEAKNAIKQGDTNDFSENELAVVRGGGKPNITYYRPESLSFYVEKDEIYPSHKDAENAAMEQMDCDYSLVDKWEDMDIEELLMWQKCIQWIAKGVNSTYDTDFMFP